MTSSTIFLPPLLAPASILTGALAGPKTSVLLAFTVFLLTLYLLPGSFFSLSLPEPSHSYPHADHTHLYLSSHAYSVKLDIYIQMDVLHCLMDFSEALQCPKQNYPSLSLCHSPTWSPQVNGTTDFPVAGATNLGDSLDSSPGLIHSIIKSKNSAF